MNSTIKTKCSHLNAPFQLTLQNGTHVLLRPVMPEDREGIQNGMAALSPESRYFRFFTSAPRLSDQQLRYFSEVDQRDHVAWLALDASNSKHPGVGVARFVRVKEEPTVAEMALTVIDAGQRRGVGTILLALLYLLAGIHGLQTLRAVVVGENTTMLRWLRGLGATGSCERGEYRLNLTVHRDPAHLPQTPSGERFKRALAAVQTAFGGSDPTLGLRLHYFGNAGKEAHDSHCPPSDHLKT
jgi:GNAT superfamily N-acetyltransferase